MDNDYWIARWRDGQTGFHQDRVTPLLEAHWDALALPPGARVLVPLAGKTRDMDWLAARGHRVVGVEIAGLAVRQFFEERGVEPEVSEDANGRHHRAGAIDLIEGDAFALDDALLEGCDAIYDRAALIALPPAMRPTYAERLFARLRPGCRGLLVTLEFPPQEKAGPPFPVGADELAALFGRSWKLDVLECKDILAEQPGFSAEGVSALHTLAWRLERS